MSVLGQLETSRPNSWRGIRSFPTSLINGQNNYNGVVVNAVNVVSATVTAFI
jgi:hypothetical protein